MTVQAVGASRRPDRIRLTAINPTGAFRKHGAPPAFLLLLLLFLPQPAQRSRLHQNRALEQPAEFLFRDALVRPQAAGGVRECLELDLQPLQFDNAIIRVPLLPNLVLLKFHALVIRSAPPMRQPFLKETAFGFTSQRSSSLAVSRMVSAMAAEARDETTTRAAGAIELPEKSTRTVARRGVVPPSTPAATL